MDIVLQCLCGPNTYSCIGAYIIQHRHYHKDWIVYVSPEQLLNVTAGIEHITILLSLVHEQHRDPYLHPSDDDSSNPVPAHKIAGIDQEQHPVSTRIDGIPHLDNCLASKPSTNDYFDIFDNEIDVWSLFSC